ncbi:MAG TPA: substrate-binding domain-containing protein [Xanthobacteraceae bacterium]|nr:substrate-binding domain-containing protein [Xanthobacteraceae bacterium]
MAKLHVMCARSMHQAVEALARDFCARTGHEIAFAFGTVGALQAKLAAGETADVLILATPAIDKLESAAALLPGTRKDVARTFVAVCIRAGAPAPDIATPEAFERTLREARAIALSDPAVGGSAGVYLAGLFERMGLAEMMKQKGLLQPTGAEVARRVVEGTADFGLTLSGEIAAVAGAVIAGPLPPPLGHDTTYCAAVAANSPARAAGEAFIAALTASSARATWERAGFAVPA